jgi:hypothetical protein
MTLKAFLETGKENLQIRSFTVKYDGAVFVYGEVDPNVSIISSFPATIDENGVITIDFSSIGSDSSKEPMRDKLPPSLAK